MFDTLSYKAWIDVTDDESSSINGALVDECTCTSEQDDSSLAAKMRKCAVGVGKEVGARIRGGRGGMWLRQQPAIA